MIQALAPRMPRGFSWAWLAIVAVAFSPGAVFAQEPTPPKGEAKRPVEDEKAEPKDDPAKAEPAEVEPTAEVFIDPNAKRTLAIFAPMTYTGPQIKVGGAGDDRARVGRMVTRAENMDPDFLKRYVEYFAVEMTKRDNINAILNPPPSPAGRAPEPRLRNLELAVNALTKPIVDAKFGKNQEFLTLFTRLLFESSLPKVLENNYLSRIDAMIVLGTAGGTTPLALDLYINQLKKADQVVWVKIWAAKGLSNAAQEGSVDLDAGKANQAADALIGLLDSDPKLPWPAQMRALEALGSIRVATANNPRKIDAASVAMRFLVDPEAKPEVRSWAAWALGMMKVPANLAPFNYNLLGHEIGELAIDLGQEIVQEFDHDPANFEREKEMASHLTGLLLFQVYPSLVGEEGVRDSGLLRSPHPNAGPSAARPFLTKVDEKVKAISREALELLRAGGALTRSKRNELDAKISDLKVFLGQVTPKDRHLVPGGPEFAPNPAEQVAGAPQP